MIPKISLTDKEQQVQDLVIILKNSKSVPTGIFSAVEKKYIRDQIENQKKEMVAFNRLGYWTYLYFIKEEKNRSKRLESCRRHGEKTARRLNRQRSTRVILFDTGGFPDETLAFAEGMALGSYQFLKYKKEKEKDTVNTLREIEIYSEHTDRYLRNDAGYGIQVAPVTLSRGGVGYGREGSPVSDHLSPVDFLNIVNEAVDRCRTLVNEPHSYLTATVFAGEVDKMAKECGAGIEIFNRRKLEAMKMGGILGVNQGSSEQPTFTVMEYRPEGAKNNKPVVFVGKGVVYDSGGMNLKPGDSMKNMKDDMSGAAAVAGAVYAIAKAGLPVHVIGLMPATDNRPGEKAMVPGDILTMHNGMTVEIINTDAEGRLLLADALSYAGKYNPALVIDLATLTGAAVRAIGSFGAAAMQTRAGEELRILQQCGEEVYERLVEFPMWDEYGELIKSDLADLKNCGPSEAGMITAAKFLEKFTDYPFIHLDIAGPAFLEKRDSYRGLGGTAFGVRLLCAFIRRYAEL